MKKMLMAKLKGPNLSVIFAEEIFARWLEKKLRPGKICLLENIKHTVEEYTNTVTCFEQNLYINMNHKQTGSKVIHAW